MSSFRNRSSVCRCWGFWTKISSCHRRALAREVGVNPNTVAKAYQQLEQQGIIYTVSGRGSFVSPDVLSLQSLRQAALQEVLDAVDKALSRGVSPQQLLDAICQQLDSLSPCNQGGTQDD